MLRTNYILIDFENVQPETLTALEQDRFKVYVFVGSNQSKIPVETAISLQRMGTNAQYIRMSGSGKNALDFHISFYIGQLAAQDPTAYFHVVSKDAGFDPLIQHLRSRKILSARSASVDEIPLIKSSAAKSTQDRTRLFIEHIQQPKATKPRTIKTLTNAIKTFFNNQPTETEIADIVSEMQNAGFIFVTDLKVSYHPVHSPGA